MGRTLKLEWQETASELQERYRQERNSEQKVRLHAFWQLRLGKSMKAVAQLVSISYRSLQNWLRWYREDGLSAVLQRIKAHGKQGRPSKLNSLQEKALLAKVGLGTFRSVWDVLQWVEARWKLQYSYCGLFKRLKRLKCRLKVPRPRSVKADVKAQNEWKVTGLTKALQEAELSRSRQVWFSDEMRFGLWGQSRKRWGLRGLKIIQPMQIEFRWQYLVLAVDPIRCKLYWAWAERMNQAQLMPIFESWKPDAVIWNGAAAHRGKAMGQVGFQRIALPAYSPELNPAERVFEYLRGKIEGQVYPSLPAKRQALEQILRQLNSNRSALRKLVSWQWIRVAFREVATAA